MCIRDSPWGCARQRADPPSGPGRTVVGMGTTAGEMGRTSRVGRQFVAAPPANQRPTHESLPGTAGSRDWTTQRLVRARHTEGSRPGQRTDPCRLALLIEGGSSRSAYSSGMVVAIERLGLREVFDDVYGAVSYTHLDVYKRQSFPSPG